MDSGAFGGMLARSIGLDLIKLAAVFLGCVAAAAMLGYWAGSRTSQPEPATSAAQPTSSYVVSVEYQPGVQMPSWADADPQAPIQFRVYFADRAAYDKARSELFLKLTELKNSASTP